MQQPEHLRALQGTQQSTSRRFVSFGFVVLFHVFVIYAFASGLANHLVEKIPTDIITKVEPPKLPDIKPPPPPPPDLAKPPPPYVPPPDIVIQQQAANTNAITVQHQAPVAPPPPKPAGITAPALIAGGARCQQSYYPPIAIRLNQEGTTTVDVHVSADGAVTGVDIKDSSGHDSLDQAAIKCITNAWRFKPAMQNGQPVATSRQFAIKWVLQ
ncbi:MAG TPA: energy transducer TonB [Rhizomicrobium sp.]|nr:energy transducer TonB [Rhizomicrobium sp.]